MQAEFTPQLEPARRGGVSTPAAQLFWTKGRGWCEGAQGDVFVAVDQMPLDVDAKILPCFGNDHIVRGIMSPHTFGALPVTHAFSRNERYVVKDVFRFPGKDPLGNRVEKTAPHPLPTVS